VGTSFSLPVAEDQDVGNNGRLEYQLLSPSNAGGPPSDSVFQLVQGVNVVDGSEDVKLVLQSSLDREQVTLILVEQKV